MHSRWSGVATIAGTLILVVVSGCSGDDEGAAGTLPPIQTTTTTTTTLAPSTTQARFYEVQSGDTLTKIAVAFGLPIQAIMQANGIVDPNSIQVGQILELPDAAAIVATSLPAPPPSSAADPGASTTVSTLAP